MRSIQFSEIKKIEEIANSSPQYVSLSQGSIKVGGIPQQVKTYIQEMLKTDKTDYYESCWGIKELREKIAEKISLKYNFSLSHRRVLPTHGCIGGLSLLFLSLLEPGDEVIIPEPAYPAYALLAKASRSVAVHVSCASKNSWKLDVEKIKAATTDKTKFIIFSNPINPLGIIVPQETLKELLAWCESKGIYLIVDEAYRDYVFEGPYTSALSFINDSEFLISANSFSKNMAMSGWRIGYLILPEPLMGVLAAMQDTLLNCLNNTAQYAALFALDHPELTDKFHFLVKKSRALAIQLLEPLVEQNIFSYTKPDGGFFMFLKTDQEDATDLCMSILHEAKVGLIPGKAFGPSGKPYLRLCYARDTDVLQKGIQRLVKYFI